MQNLMVVFTFLVFDPQVCPKTPFGILMLPDLSADSLFADT